MAYTVLTALLGDLPVEDLPASGVTAGNAVDECQPKRRHLGTKQWSQTCEAKGAGCCLYCMQLGLVMGVTWDTLCRPLQISAPVLWGAACTQELALVLDTLLSVTMVQDTIGLRLIWGATTMLVQIVARDCAVARPAGGSSPASVHCRSAATAWLPWAALTQGGC